MKVQQNCVNFLVSGLASALSLGCLAPPPNCVDPKTGATMTADGSGAAPAAAGAAAATTASTDPGDLSKPLVVWNGDDVSPTAKQWASCDTQPCTSTLEPAPKVGANGTIGLEFKAKGKGYVGFGWNWTSWYAAGATNVTGRKNLKFQFKLVPASPELAPAGDGIRVGIRCAKQDKCGKEIGSITKYEPKATDGQWHQVTIPLGDMKVEDKGIWDDASAWEIGVHNWAPTPREFVAYIDDITFE
jgi:hypothetical protein